MRILCCTLLVALAVASTQAAQVRVLGSVLDTVNEAVSDIVDAVKVNKAVEDFLGVPLDVATKFAETVLDINPDELKAKILEDLLADDGAVGSVVRDVLEMEAVENLTENPLIKGLLDAIADLLVAVLELISSILKPALDKLKLLDEATETANELAELLMLETDDTLCLIDSLSGGLLEGIVPLSC